MRVVHFKFGPTPAMARHALIAIFSVALWSTAGAFAQDGNAPKSGWVVDDSSGCAAWTAFAGNVDSVRWTGPCKDGKTHGTGELRLRLDGEPVGRYRGEVRGGKPHGKGIFKRVRDGMRCEGALREGLLHGQAVCSWPTGARYEGEFLRNMMHGRGTLTGTNGLKFDGEFRGNRPHGHGRIERPDGSGFEGQIVGGKAQGYGKCREKSGRWRRCQVRDGDIVRWLD